MEPFNAKSFCQPIIIISPVIQIAFNGVYEKLLPTIPVLTPGFVIMFWSTRSFQR